MTLAKYCTIRHGTSLDVSIAKNVFRNFPLPEKLLQVDIQQWDGKSPLPHCFYISYSEGQRVHPHSTLEASCKGYPSVTTLISCISRKEGLYKWQQYQIELLGRAGYRENSLKRMNTSFKLHKLLENSLKDLCIDGIIKPIEQIIEENEKNEKPIPIEYLHSILPMFTDILKEVKEIKNICFEQMVYNHQLIYRGKFDAILPINGELTLVDWKGCSVGTTKSQKTPENAELSLENKMQLAAYVAAINLDPEYSHILKIKNAAIVNFFASGREAEIIKMCEEELEEYYERYKGWLNAFWWTLATAKAKRLKGEELIDFCYDPQKEEGK